MVEDKATLNFDMTPELDALVEAEAKRLQVSKAAFVRMRLVEYFENKKGGDNGSTENNRPTPAP